MSGARRVLSSTAGSTFFASAYAAALSSTADRLVRNCTNTGTGDLYMEMGMAGGPSIACIGRKQAWRAYRLRESIAGGCVPDAVQRAAERSGAPLIRDRHGLKRSRVCSAPLRAALRPGHTA